MARITSHSSLNHGTEFAVDYSAKTVTLTATGNLSAGSANGVNLDALFAALENHHKSGSGTNVYRWYAALVDGPIGTMMELRGGWEFANSASIALIRNGGFAYTSDYAGTTKTAEYFCPYMLGTVKTSTDQPYYLLGSDTTPTNFGVADEFNECIQVYGDASHGNFDKRSGAKFFVRTAGDSYLGYDLFAEQSISASTYRSYAVPGSTATDAGVSTTSPSGSPYSGMTLTLGATTNTINSTSYNFAEGEIDANSGTVQQVYDWFQWLLRQTSDIDAGAGTQRGDTYLGGKLTFSGGVITTSQGLTIKNIATADASNIIHVDDTGTGRQQAATNSTSVTNLPTDGAAIRLQIYNVTAATEIYNADPSGASYSDTYTEGGDYTTGDAVRIRFAELNAGTSFKSFETVVTASASGWSVDASNFIESDSVYATNGVNGSTVTKFTYTAVDDQFNLVVAQNWTAAELFAFYCYTLTTSAGIEGAWGGFTAIDAGNYRNNTSVVSVYLDNETTATQRQTDTARVFRDDDAYPVLDPTTSGYGIDVNWKNVVYVVSTGGSALTPTESAKLLALPSAADVVNEWETQSQADPTGFHVNVKEMNGANVYGAGTESDKWRGSV